MSSRRHFLTQNLALGALGVVLEPAHIPLSSDIRQTERLSLNGPWLFRLDPDDEGEKQSWFAGNQQPASWGTVEVPHTWQIEAPLVDYRGVVWYRPTFDSPTAAGNSAVRVEFESVFHSARVWVSGIFAGEHHRKGYTAFTLDIDALIHPDLIQPNRQNVIAVRVDNAFNDHMLPRGRSSDWAHDGGIYRPVQLLVTPRAFIERVDVDAVPDFESGDAAFNIIGFSRNAAAHNWNGEISLRVLEDASGDTVLKRSLGRISLEPHSEKSSEISAVLPNARRWHFDQPNLYYGYGQIPIEQQELPLPDLAPGQEVELRIGFAEDRPEYIQFDVLRPTGFSAYSQVWQS